MNIRLIPVLIFIMALSIADRGFDLLGISWVQQSMASSAPKVEKKDAHAKEGEAKAEAEEKKPEEKKSFSNTKPQENIPQFTKGEKEVLEKLSARREELQKWENELEIKQKLIEASSQKLDEKLTELKAVQQDTAVLLKEYNEHEDAKIRSLVKIYEGMKPKDAANILNEMDLDISLEIIDKMSERKASGVIAAMDTKRARKITEEIALQRSLKEAQGKRNINLSNSETVTQ